jgi:hypothetical protein
MTSNEMAARKGLPDSMSFFPEDRATGAQHVAADDVLTSAGETGCRIETPSRFVRQTVPEQDPKS